MRRTTDEISGVPSTFAAVSSEVDIVDPFFDLQPTESHFLAPRIRRRAPDIVVDQERFRHSTRSSRLGVATLLSK
jgi:hypothetical protein